MRSFVLVLLSLLIFPCSFVLGKRPPPLLDATLDEINGGLESGQFTSVDLVKAYIARIKEVNSTLHVVTEVNPDAVKIAKQLDKERAGGSTRGPLHGIPILIKGNVGTNDKLNTTAGSYALLGSKLPRDSTVASKLRKAGAVILGVTNLSQWANFRSFNSSNGWSAYGGQCYGAYYPKQDPSGSSSGSGVASSLGLAFAALGTETDGSIVSPGSANNIVGIKPSVGLTSRYLVVPISEHQDSVGAMGRTVRDAAAVLQAIAGADRRDNYTSAIPDPDNLPDYLAACDPTALKGARIGIPQNVINDFKSFGDPSIVNAFNNAVRIMKRAGAVIVPTNFTRYGALQRSPNEGIVLDSDFYTNIPEYFSQLTYNPYNISSVKSLLKFTVNTPAEWYPHYDVRVFREVVRQGFGNTDPRAYAAYRANQRLGGRGNLLDAIRRDNLDAVILPTAISSTFGAIIGSPIITVPLGFYPQNQPVRYNNNGNLVDSGPNIPYGISFLGKRFSEAPLISYAYAYEQLTHVRLKQKPYIQPKTEISDVM